MQKRKHNRRTSIGESFVPRTATMLESPAYRVLSQSEHRCLSRIEVELCHHGGADNGKLPVTFDDFEEYGVHRHSIKPALRGLAALGFIEITREGRAGNAEWRRPTWFRLTYLPNVDLAPTHEWRRIQTIEEAEAIARAARRPSKKQNANGGNCTKVRCGNRTTSSPIHSAEIGTTCVSAESTTTSISRGGGRRRHRVNGTAQGTTSSSSTITGAIPASGGFGETRTFAVISGGGIVTPVAVGCDRLGHEQPTTDDEAFEAFWAAYPKITKPRNARMKRAARTAFEKAVERGLSPGELVVRVEEYRAERAGKNLTRTKYAHHWLRQQQPADISARAAGADHD